MFNIYGVRGIANTWLENYPINRKQYVVVDNQASSMQFIKCGVPQGSVLGPVLFLLFINDMYVMCQTCLKMLIQYDLPTKKTPNNIHECSAWLGEFK